MNNSSLSQGYLKGKSALMIFDKHLGSCLRFCENETNVNGGDKEE